MRRDDRWRGDDCLKDARKYRKRCTTLKVRCTTLKATCTTLRENISDLEAKAARWQARAEDAERDLQTCLARQETALRRGPQTAGHRWQFAGTNNHNDWTDYTPENNALIAQSYQGGIPTCDVKHGSAEYKVDMIHMHQTNKMTNKCRAVRCTFDLPSHWSLTDDHILSLLKAGTTCGEIIRLVPVDNRTCGTIEKVLRKNVFHAAGRDGVPAAVNQGSRCEAFQQNMVLVSVDRIENLQLFLRYQSFCQRLRNNSCPDPVAEGKITPQMKCSKKLQERLLISPLDQSVNEQLLFHGTNPDAGTWIVREGFDHRVANPGWYGRGTYFTPHACKAANPKYGGSEEEKVIIVARVAVGTPHFAEKVDKTMTRPPENEWSYEAAARYDSVVALPGPMPGHRKTTQLHTEVSGGTICLTLLV